MTAKATAAHIGVGTSDDWHWAIRVVTMLVADFRHAGSDGAELLTEEPPPTGDERFDALLAGVVEHLAFQTGLPVPRWTLHPSRFLTQWWFATDTPGMRPYLFQRTPAPLANRGVFVDQESLENV